MESSCSLAEIETRWRYYLRNLHELKHDLIQSEITDGFIKNERFFFENKMESHGITVQWLSDDECIINNAIVLNRRT